MTILSQPGFEILSMRAAKAIRSVLGAATFSAGLDARNVVRDDRDGEISYLLHCERSSGQYLFDALIDAGDEFGIEVDGFVGLASRGD
jgi:glycine cleavage system aminomethyltransferase T